MAQYRKGIVLVTVVFTLVAFIPSAHADPHALAKPPKPPGGGLAECQAKVAELEATNAELQEQIADQDVVIGELEEQIDVLQTSLDGYKNYAPVRKTGQQKLDDSPLTPGDDGELQKGVEWPDPRFTDNLDGTVTDNMTKLVWMQDSNIFGFQNWYEALADCYNFIAGWRLPNVLELLSLVDFDYYTEGFRGALPEGHPFTNPTGGSHWTSTTSHIGNDAWIIAMWQMGSYITEDAKAIGQNMVWCVRDPQ